MGKTYIEGCKHNFTGFKHHRSFKTHLPALSNALRVDLGFTEVFRDVFVPDFALRHEILGKLSFKNFIIGTL